MAQYALPTSDVSKTDWSEGAGNADANAFDELDEGFGAGRGSGSGPDDATTYWLTTTDLAGLKLQHGNLTDPGVDTGHIVRQRTRKSAAAGQQQDHGVYWAKGSGSTRRGAIFTNVDEVWTTRAVTLTAQEVIDVVDYVDVESENTIDEIGGGAGREAQDSAHECECPDAGAPPVQASKMTLQGVGV